MNTCNSINSVALGKLLKKYKLTPKNKQKVILLAQRKTATWSALHRQARKLEFQQTVTQQHQQQQWNIFRNFGTTNQTQLLVLVWHPQYYWGFIYFYSIPISKWNILFGLLIQKVNILRSTKYSLKMDFKIILNIFNSLA